MNKKNIYISLIIVAIISFIYFVIKNKITFKGQLLILAFIGLFIGFIILLNKIMNKYLTSSAKCYVSFFCWMTFILFSSIIYSFIGLVSDLSIKKNSKIESLFYPIYYSQVKIDFSKKYSYLFKNNDFSIKSLSDIIPIDKEWINLILQDRKPVFQNKSQNAFNYLTGSIGDFKKMRHIVDSILLQLKKEKNLDLKFKTIKRLLIFSEIYSRGGTLGNYTTLIEFFLGNSLEKKVLSYAKEFLNKNPKFWTKSRKDDFADFLKFYKKYRLSIVEVLEGESKYTNTILTYFYANHTYAMFWLDLYFGNAIIQFNNTFYRTLKIIEKNKSISQEKWNEIYDNISNVFIKISVPNLRIANNKFLELNKNFEKTLKSFE